MQRSAAKIARAKRRDLIDQLMDCRIGTTFKPQNGYILEK